ncbi:MAG: glucose-1-phosphate cytidylyltransferase [Gemmataceae bacterium]|jgi:glucose-1-phosphate cytidylyltransferase
MQAVILCGGQGTRLRDTSEHLPKPMVPVGGKPILWHVMKHCASHGIREFILCLGYKGHEIKRWFLDYHLRERDLTVRLGRPDQVEIHPGHGDDEDWLVTLAETGEHTMTGGRLNRVAHHIRGERFLFTYADGLSDVDIGALEQFHKGHGRLATLTAVAPPGRFGELTLDGDAVQAFQEKPRHAAGRINGGYFMLDRGVLDRLDDNPSLVWEREPLEHLAETDQLRAFAHDGFWHAMDTTKDYLDLNRMWESGSAPWLTWDRSTRSRTHRIPNKEAACRP